MILIAALFLVSCGDDDDNTPRPGGYNPGSECSNDGDTSCSDDSNFVMKCQNGKWEKNENCSEDNKTCKNAKCVAEGGNGGSGNGGSGNGGSGSGEGGSGNSEGDSCAEIFSCIQDSKCYIDDAECTGACIEKGNQDGQDKANTMIDCFIGKCGQSKSQEEFNNCLNEQCASEIQACGIGGGGAEADGSYNSTYGTLKVNVSIDAVATIEDQEEQKEQQKQYEQTGQEPENPNYDGYITSAAITGTYGNGSTSVVPAGSASTIAFVSWGEETTSQGPWEGVSVQQISYDSGNNPMNPIILLSIDADAVAIGSIDVSPFQGSVASIQVIDINWTTQKAKCMHAFGEGSLKITVADDVENGGALALSGEITLYSPKNYKGQDLTQYNDITACDPVQ